MLKQLPEIEMPKGLEAEIEKKITDFFDDYLFNFIKEVLNDNVIENSKGIVSALLMGRLKYDNKGLFYTKGKMSSSLAKQLEAIGGKWSKSAKGYRIKDTKIPTDVLQAIARVNIHNRNKFDRIKTYLDGLQDTKDFVLNNLSFDIEINRIGKKLDAQLKNTLKPIGVVPAEMTEFQRKEIAKNYTNNLNYYVQKWTGSEIIRMREKLQPIILGGYRAEEMEKMLQEEEGVSKKKAKFLARQETKLLTAEYRKNRLKEYGVNRYRWRTILDGRERKLHRELNGQIFSWDSPPIIDEHKNILEAIKQRDSQKAKDLVLAHLNKLYIDEASLVYTMD
ncbi:MAG: minor capsid protein, partial [Acutalibacteraceae bacterium]|nr:minor capsid protein [Acutalibacteraceae bacterium]